MKFLKIIFFSIFIFSCTWVEAQYDIQSFRKLEKRVRYNYPDSLLIFAGEMDTNDLRENIFRYLAEGKHHFYKSRFDKSYEKLTKAKSLSVVIRDPLIYAEISLDISSCFSMLENTGKSLDELFYAKRIFDRSGNDNQKARLHLALGELYRKIGQYDKAAEMLITSKKYIHDDHSLMASYYNRRAAVKSETSQMDSAYLFSIMALAESKRSDDASLVGISENEIGYILKHKNKKDSAFIHFKKADSVFRSCGMTAYALQSTAHYAVLMSEAGQTRQAVFILKEGYDIANENNWYRLKRDYSEYLRNSYLALNIKDSFYYYQSEMKDAQISLIVSQYEMNTRLVELMFQEEKFQQQINKKEQLLVKEREEKKFMIIVIALIILVLILLIYMIFVQIKRRKIILKDKQEKERQNRELEKLLKNNEALVQEISHRVKNNLSVLSGLLGIQKARASNPELKKELEETILRIESISAIHNQLYDSKETAQVNLGSAFLNMGNNICKAMGYQSEIIMKYEMDNVELDIVRSVNLSMILNELLTNSFKHAVKNDKNSIIVRLRKNGNIISLTVIDDGEGISVPEAAVRLNESGSMGLYLIDILCRQLKAKKETKKDNTGFYSGISFEL